ncbi:DUF2971 domain-containing protein [Acinetobacter soli]|uniref:DUF2971 domain-containing protein n=1 Tax=Acinetobacter soli TaxID=487316 RepID=UPI0004A819E2|nr:DUF2971 domain-containing protein [Acinetobacter soli]
MDNLVLNFAENELAENTTLWRYMDFSKFVDFILSRELYLRRIDSFTDKFEGQKSDITIIYFRKFLKQLYPDQSEDFMNQMVENFIFGLNATKLQSYVNCWHINEFESAGMWNLYAKTEEAIAIKTNLKKLKYCLENSVRPDTNSAIYIDKVFYIDYENEALITRNNNIGFVEHLFNKRKSFEHEKEFRILYMSQELYDWDEKNESGTLNIERVSEREKCNDEKFKSKLLPINLTELITEIYVSPTAPLWFYEMTKKFLKSVGLGDLVCTQSKLYTLK